ncbi:hypothetical protein V8G54_009469 [Vigna mungo]|uniref:Uncharacterized protein n=1 Tax=Vigna mungo TaxID=3915 RepID=A0AAQ3S3W5_VIGMU
MAEAEGFIDYYKLQARRGEGLLRREVILRPRRGVGGRGPPLAVEELRQLNLSPEVIGCVVAAGGNAALLRRVGGGGGGLDYHHVGGLGGGGLDVAGGAGGRERREAVDLVGEIELRLAALEAVGCDIVGLGRHLRCREGAQPYARLLARLPDFGHPFSPAALADATEERMTRAASLRGGLIGGGSGGAA